MKPQYNNISTVAYMIVMAIVGSMFLCSCLYYIITHNRRRMVSPRGLGEAGGGRLHRSHREEQEEDSQLAEAGRFQVQLLKLHALPVVAFGQLTQSQAEHSGCTECSICLMDFEKDSELRMLKCQHFFHRPCIDTWFSGCADSGAWGCPLCKAHPTAGQQPGGGGSGTPAEMAAAEAGERAADDYADELRRSGGAVGRGGRREEAAQRRRDGAASRLHDAQARAALSAPLSVQETLATLGGGGGGGGGGTRHVEIEMQPVAPSAFRGDSSGRLPVAMASSAPATATATAVAVGSPMMASAPDASRYFVSDDGISDVSDDEADAAGAATAVAVASSGTTTA
jgi:hypothetical protein